MRSKNMATRSKPATVTDVASESEPVEIDVVSAYPEETVGWEEAWNSADEIEGAEPTDKAELIDVPHLITGARFFRQRSNGASMVELEARTRDGEVFSYQDSSTTGVRAQVIQYLQELIGVTDPLSASDDHWFNFALKAPRGLRVSAYEATVPVKGS